MSMYAYKNTSKSARAVAEGLGKLLINHTNSAFRGSYDKTVLNWGSGELPYEVRLCKVVNSERSVCIAINKLSTLTQVSEYLAVMNAPPTQKTIPFTTVQAMARVWLQNGRRVFARTRLEGKDGEGIVECTRDNIPTARLYTMFINAVSEYRINASRNEIIGSQLKVRVDERPEGGYNDEIKTTSGGYGFRYINNGVPEPVLELAKKAIQALELDFGGVDIIWDGRVAYLLEVNTAPYMTPQLVTNFVRWYRNNYGQ